MNVIKNLSTAIVLGMVVNLLPTSKATAAAITFKKIIDTTSSPLNGSYPNLFSPAINDSGRVAFIAEDETGRGIFTSNGGSITKITDTISGSFDTIGNPAINNSGIVAFRAALKGGVLNGVGPGVGIYTGNGGALNTISFNANAGSFLVSQPSINNSGTVAFADNESGDIYTSKNRKLNLVANADGGNPVINNQGTVSFVLPGASLVTRNNQVTTTIADTKSSFSSLSGDGSPLNDEGTVAFLAYLNSGEQSIFTGNGGSLNTIADTKGAFSTFVGSPAINNQGTVAFWAFLNSGEEGIFTGSDPVKNKVIATGDQLLGSTVTEISSFGLEGLNNRDQIAFGARLANGTEGIYVATTAVPEPYTVASSGLALAGLVFFKRRCQPRGRGQRE
ncbi:DUF7453 family protein [Halotia branconii]|uniref:PEP-CTERM sorting domain-containing protein n=1 Tax=Halotia branconii CENA392 TaxID=1539056 RepID=A0AAJ6NUY2_9CYAN|nr:choice-of-anchor tandem repeat NxxGxxAF-containing protein [Halotia branconii]WGV27193.1 PEP-CTERM sorting domain-containing protein [Halotia branconii CENA392]